MGKLLEFPNRWVKPCVFCSQTHDPDFDCMAKIYVLALTLGSGVTNASDYKRVFDALGDVEKTTLDLILVPKPDND
jgi:hypothetical protein